MLSSTHLAFSSQRPTGAYRVPDVTATARFVTCLLRNRLLCSGRTRSGRLTRSVSHNRGWSQRGATVIPRCAFAFAVGHSHSQLVQLLIPIVKPHYTLSRSSPCSPGLSAPPRSAPASSRALAPRARSPPPPSPGACRRSPGRPSRPRSACGTLPRRRTCFARRVSGGSRRARRARFADTVGRSEALRRGGRWSQGARHGREGDDGSGESGAAGDMACIAELIPGSHPGPIRQRGEHEQCCSRARAPLKPHPAHGH